MILYIYIILDIIFACLTASGIFHLKKLIVEDNGNIDEKSISFPLFKAFIKYSSIFTSIFSISVNIKLIPISFKYIFETDEKLKLCDIINKN